VDRQVNYTDDFWRQFRTPEEKAQDEREEAMTDKEIEEWEAKIAIYTRYQFNRHAHLCPSCETAWECQQISHCRRPNTVLCADCAAKD
jgi:hypothetical protein